MTDDRSLERAAQSWLELGPTQAPDHAVDAALARIQTTRQERGPWIPWRMPTMNSASRLVAGLAAIATVIVVGVILVGPRLGSNVAGPPSPSPSATASPTQAPTGTPSATASDAACKLLTTDEVKNSTIFPGGGAIAAPFGTGAVTSCTYTTGGGDITLRVTYTNPGGQAAFDAMKSTAGVQAVADVGDEAIFDPATETLYLVKGDALVSLAAGMFVDGRLAKETQLGKLIAARI
jgi:hypothetical protein